MQPERPKNRLAQERSPYLQQHATNPVDWRPWSESAFDEARQTGKPVFLSIGYSACHWCHVMEHESFADESTAALLNRDFISIKVDREERPDIDHIYQLAFQLLHQRGGGWPLSIFLTPDKQPFFAGTYFPPARRYGMPSFQEVLHAIGSAYKERRADVLAQAQELTEVLGRVTQGAKEQAGPLSPEALSRVLSSLTRRIDKTHGGFGTKPKFPNVMSVDLLLLGYALEGNAEAWTLASRTLRGMARGGIYDHLGGGFARYSTDERWLVPHFEKMLYDNGLLLRLYLDGWRLAREAGGEISPQHCQEIIEETARYLDREMTASNGAFFSAQDADSEGEEGKFFVWTPKQVASLLEISDAEAACAYFDISDAGNFEHGATVLATPREFAEVAARLRRPEPEIRAAVGRAKEAMFAAREKREKPFRDEKCLASWNGLVIGALADAGASLERPDWVERAARGLAAWRGVAWQKGRLSHAMKDGEPYGDGFLDDYAGLANAALDLFEARFAAEDLGFARELIDRAIALFWDESSGDCYHTPQDGELVLHRAKDAHDQAYPGGVGLFAQALLRLATLRGEASYRERAERVLQSTARAAGENPMGLSTVARAIDWAARGSVEVVIVGEISSEAGRALLRGGRGVYVPHRSLVAAPSAEAAQALGLSRLLFEGRAPLPDGSPRAYVCRGQLCEAPVSDPDALRALLLQYARATH